MIFQTTIDVSKNYQDLENKYYLQHTPKKKVLTLTNINFLKSIIIDPNADLTGCSQTKVIISV